MGPTLSWSFYWLWVRANSREPQRTGWVGGGSDVSQLFVHWQEHVPSVPRKQSPHSEGRCDSVCSTFEMNQFPVCLEVGRGVSLVG